MSTKILFPQVGARNESSTFYALIWNEDGQVRQFTTNTFVAYVTANLDNYDVGAATCTAGGHFSLSFPALPAGKYFVEIFKRASVAVAETDEFVSSTTVWWDGAKLVELDQVGIDLTKTVPIEDLSAKTTQTIGDCLSAARADAAGDQAKSGTTLTLYGPDNSVVRSFVYDNAVAPTSRT